MNPNEWKENKNSYYFKMYKLLMGFLERMCNYC